MMRLLSLPTLTLHTVKHTVREPSQWDKATIVPEETDVYTTAGTCVWHAVVEGPMVLGRNYDITLSIDDALVKFDGLRAISETNNVYECTCDHCMLITNAV